MKNLSIEIFEVTSSQKTFYTPRYGVINNVIENSKITSIHGFKKFDLLNIGAKLQEIDFQNFEGDVIYVSDDISMEHLQTYTDNFSEFFRDKIVLYQIDSNVFDKNGRNHFKDNEVRHDNEKKAFQIYHSLFYCDAFLATRYIWDIMKRQLLNLYNEETVAKLEEKVINLPTPGIYRFDNEFINMDKDFSQLHFLWNHRIVPEKRFEVFVETISKFHDKYPDIPFRVSVCTTNRTKTLKKIPANIHPFCDLIDFVREDEAYKDLLKKTNISLGTSDAESFGISAMEFIKFNSVYLNLDKNEVFEYYLGGDTTFNETDVVDAIAKVYQDENYRNEVLSFNRESFLKNIPSREEYVKTLRESVWKHVQAKIDKRGTDKESELLNNAVKLFENKKVVTRAEIYDAFGWGDPKSNKWWSFYYYKLRAAGIHVVYYKDKVYYTMTDYDQLKPEDFKNESEEFFEFE